MAGESILVGIPEIAQLAGVSRSAVSNWRKRYGDFPEPRVQSDTGVLFDLRMVEEWLLTRRKIDGPIRPGALLTRASEALRAAWPGASRAESSSLAVFDFTSSWLCYLEACARATHSPVFGDGMAAGTVVAEEDRWSEVRQVGDEGLAVRLRTAARSIEAANPRLAGLLDHLAPDPFPDPSLVRFFVSELEASVDDVTNRVALFEEARRDAAEVARVASEFGTPDVVAQLAAGLAGELPPGAVVVDPACGTGGLLLMAGVLDQLAKGHARFVGVDVNESAVRHTRARFFLYGIDADVTRADSLRQDPVEWPAADVVLCDPPYGLSNWGDAELYRSDRWQFGSPPPHNADLAWVQLAVCMLKPAGRGIVVTPPGACFRGGREAGIREALVRAGAVRAVVHLPPRLRRDTSIPLVVWVLGAPGGQTRAGGVLLVDATELGAAGRATHDLAVEDVDALVNVVEGFLATGAVQAAHERIEARVVDLEELEPQGFDLTARRYLVRRLTSNLEEIRAECESAGEEVRIAVDDLVGALDELDELTNTSLDGGAVERVRLDAVADVFRPRAGKGETPPIAQTGDLLLATFGRGFVARLVDAGDPLDGLHAICLRCRPAAAVSAEWLLLWARSDEFVDLVRRHSKGETLRSLRVADLSAFEVPVPSPEVQARAGALVAVLDRLEDAAQAIASTVDRVRVSEVAAYVAEVVR